MGERFIISKDSQRSPLFFLQHAGHLIRVRSSVKLNKIGKRVCGEAESCVRQHMTARTLLFFLSYTFSQQESLINNEWEDSATTRDNLQHYDLQNWKSSLIFFLSFSSCVLNSYILTLKCAVKCSLYIMPCHFFFSHVNVPRTSNSGDILLKGLSQQASQQFTQSLHFYQTRQSNSVTVLRQLRTASVNDTRLTCLYCAVFRSKISVCVFFFRTCANQQVNTDSDFFFLKAYCIYMGYSFLSFFLFN